MEHVTFTSAGRIAILTLARPDIRNAITGPEMLDEVTAALRHADADPDIGVLIITGEGSAFSAGGNVKDMRAGAGIFEGTPDEISEKYRASIQQIPRLMLATDLVTIAAVNGPAVGAGFDLALMCDLRIGSFEARFAHTFIDLGIIPGDGGAWFLPRVVGWQRAAELAFTARIVTAEEAVEMGILLEVVEPADLLERARVIAEQIAAKPPHSVRLTKRLLRHARSMELDGFLDISAALQSVSHHTEDHREAIEAFFERRPGRFKGR
jgi:enoyl-CoA hydratase/carnithine racemase